MSGLLRAAPAGGIDSMQHINRTVITTQFVAGILVIPFLSILFAFYAFSTIHGAALHMIILAPTVYVPTVLLITMFGNVPMNNKLAALDPTSSEAEQYWRMYGRAWTRLNHVRAIGSVATAGLYMAAGVALIKSGQA